MSVVRGVLSISLAVVLGGLVSACGQESGEGGKSAVPPLKNLVLVKTVTGLQTPESVIHDEKRDQYYVSQIGKNGPETDGTLALIKPDGTLADGAFVKGLRDPHGMAIKGDALFVADRDALVEIDLEARTVVASFPAEGAKYLNDVAVGDDGTVYVSDILVNRIYRLVPGGELEVFVEGPQLMQPNGLTVHDGALYFVNWGPASAPTLEALMAIGPKGKLARIDLGDKSVTQLSGPLGSLDAVEFDEKGGALVTDWRGGIFYYLAPDGAELNRYDIAKIIGAEKGQGLADIDYVQKKQQVLAPMMLQNSLLILGLER